VIDYVQNAGSFALRLGSEGDARDFIGDSHSVQDNSPSQPDFTGPGHGFESAADSMSCRNAQETDVDPGMARRLPTDEVSQYRELSDRRTSLAHHIVASMSSRRPATSLRRRYFAALLCVAALIVLDQLLIQPELAKLTFDAPVINVSGRQRMLSQNLTKTAMILVQETDAAQRAKHRQTLSEILNLWTRSQAGLRFGDAELQLPGQNPPEVEAAFQDVEAHFETIRTATMNLLDEPADRTSEQRDADDQQVAIILEHEPQFLSRMHRIVGMYEAETRSHVERLERTSWTIAGAILLTMGLLHIIAIRPATRVLERQFVQAEDQYQAVIESINEGLTQVDRAGRIVFCNQQFSLLTGRAPESLQGMLAEKLFVAGTLRPLLQSQVSPTESAQPQELQLLTPAGQNRICWVSPRRLLDDDNRTRGWVLVVMDVTERRAAEARAQSLSDQLAHADRLKSVGEIAAGLAHEVNQPLGAITNYAEGALVRLNKGELTLAEVETPLRRIVSAALRAGGIIHGVKRFSRHRPHTLAQTDINVLVQEIVELCGFELRRHQVRCHVDCQGSLPLVSCDVLQIGQVLTNLIQNASQALEQQPADQRDIWLETRQLDEARLQLTVRDNGPGIPPDILSRLFEPFSTTRTEGLGMGLSIVRSIVDAHGGTVTASPLPAGGVEFRVTLPCHPLQVRSDSPPVTEVCHV